MTQHKFRIMKSALSQECVLSSIMTTYIMNIKKKCSVILIKMYAVINNDNIHYEYFKKVCCHLDKKCMLSSKIKYIKNI